MMDDIKFIKKINRIYRNVFTYSDRGCYLVDKSNVFTVLGIIKKGKKIKKNVSEKLYNLFIVARDINEVLVAVIYTGKDYFPWLLFGNSPYNFFLCLDIFFSLATMTFFLVIISTFFSFKGKHLLMNYSKLVSLDHGQVTFYNRRMVQFVLFSQIQTTANRPLIEN